MKRVRVAPGKFVTISAELSEKAARVFGTGLTRDQVRSLKASEPRSASGMMLGSAKPLALARAEDLRGAVGGFPRLPQPHCAEGVADAPDGES